MADLDLEVLKNSLKGVGSMQSIDLGAVARIRRLDGASMEKSVAVGVGGGATRIEGLDGGVYEVQLHLPSGKILAQEVEVGATDDISRLIFDAGGAPNRMLGWQHFAGAVASRADRIDTLFNLSARGLDLEASFDPTDDDHSPDDIFASALGATPDHGRPKLLMIEAPSANETAEPDGARTLEVWKALANGVRGEIRPVQMVKGFVCKRQNALDETDNHDTWRFGFAPDHVSGKRPPRRFAHVQLAGSSELVSLPLPWRTDGYQGNWQPEDYVDLVVDSSGRAKPVRSSVMVRDNKYSGIIAYMNNGAMTLAGELMRAGNIVEARAVDLLSEKARSPLGACAAAYVLLSTTSFDGAQGGSWLSWIENLGTNPRYNWIPDAALLCARVRMQTAETQAQVLCAIPLLHRALRNGLPFYSLGLSWMLEALTRLRKEDSLLNEIFPHVEKVARYLDVSQAFLVLKFDAPDA